MSVGRFLIETVDSIVHGFRSESENFNSGI